ncbi:MAG: RagB/SusD family nutrient uptake outer membrane protein [Flavobacteriales bacterium]|jgi:hypothetical protein
MKSLKFFLLAVAFGIGATSCNKLLEYPPSGAILAEDALNSTDDAQRLLNSCYDVMANVFDGSYQNMSELLSDNLARPTSNTDYQRVFDRTTDFFTPTPNGVYADFYYTIYRCNSLLANFDLIPDLSEADRNRMEAEARFIRAWCHWHVCKLWAQPYGYSSSNSHLGIIIRDEPSNDPLPRNTVAEVYDFIVNDLSFAYNNLPASNGIYANRYSAAGALAMVNFQMNKFQETISFVDEIVNSGAFAMSDTVDRFPSIEDHTALGNPEAIFQIVSFDNDVRTDELIGNYNYGGVILPALTASDDFNLLMQNAGQDDRALWISQLNSSHLINRFQEKRVFNVPLIHLTELRLLRAEALASLNQDLSTAIDDINAVRTRAYGGFNELGSGATASEIIAAAREEYRKETLGEGKWLDQLKRRGAFGENITIRNAPWDCPGSVLQFPNSEFNSSLFVGNPEAGCN